MLSKKSFGRKLGGVFEARSSPEGCANASTGSAELTPLDAKLHSREHRSGRQLEQPERHCLEVLHDGGEVELVACTGKSTQPHGLEAVMCLQMRRGMAASAFAIHCAQGLRRGKQRENGAPLIGHVGMIDRRESNIVGAHLQAERLQPRAMFRDAFRRNRCAISASGSYELVVTIALPGVAKNISAQIPVTFEPKSPIARQILTMRDADQVIVAGAQYDAV